MKTCKKCGIEKPLEAFLKPRPSVLHPPCRACTNASARAYRQTPNGKAVSERAELRYRKTPEAKARKRARSLGKVPKNKVENARRYHLNKILKTYAPDVQVKIKQDLEAGRCMACTRGPGRRRLAIDHDHVSGEYRGILCHPCNMALGLLRDDQAVINSLRDYLISR